MNDKIILELKGLCFSYGKQESGKQRGKQRGKEEGKEEGKEGLFRELSFKLKENEVVCILGLSGSGKSTLLKLANRLLECSRGSIFYKGRDIQDYDPLLLRREISYLPQLPCLIDASVLDNLLLPFERGFKPDRGILEAMLEELGIGGNYLERAANSLSIGEKQRVGLARILLLRSTRILLLDEPNASIDEHNSLIFLQALKKLVSRLSLSVIIVTHQSSFASMIGSRFFILRGGKLEGVSSLSNISLVGSSEWQGS